VKRMSMSSYLMVQFIMIKMQKIKTVKEVASKLNISLTKAYRIKKEIEENTGAPSYMVWGTGFNKQFTLSSFREILKKEKACRK